MKRRAFLAASAVAMGSVAGCTASGGGDEDELSADDVTVSGIGDSDVYHFAEVDRSASFMDLLPFQELEISIQLVFDPDAEYNPLDHKVLLVEGHEKVAEGSRVNEVMSHPENDRVEFEIPVPELEREPSYTVVSYDAIRAVDEFDLSVAVEDGGSGE